MSQDQESYIKEAIQFQLHNNSFCSSISKQLSHYLTQSQESLQRQVFSQQMVENLINDLLDLAKLENHSFSLNVGFFNLGDIIHRAFEMLLFSANEAGIELRAQIDEMKHLKLIQ